MSRFSIEPSCSHYIKKDQPRVGLFLSLDQLNDRARMSVAYQIKLCSNRKMYLSDYKLLLKRLVFALTLYPVVRVLFYFFNQSHFESLSFSEVMLPLLYGVRFDFSTMLIANSFFIILSCIPLRHFFYQILLKLVFIFSNTVALGVSIVDLEFFKFNGKKLTIDILGIGGDISDQLFQIAIYYWHFSLMIVCCIAFYWFFYPRRKEKTQKISYIWTPLIGLGLIVFTFIGIRGGLQMRSISPKEAYIFEKYEQGHLAINSAYTLVRSIEKNGVKPVSFYSSLDKAVEKIKSTKNFSFHFEQKRNDNIIIIILESFSQEYIDKGYAPFVSSLARQGLYFNKNMANGRRSIEALPSILVGIPSVIDDPIYQSPFQTNRFISLPETLKKKKGYHTSFFHGGKTGTMDFDAYTSSIGIDHYFGKEDYPDANDYDGHWGIYDDKFFDFYLNKLNGFPTPFVSAFFSLSSHQPYSVPERLKGKFPKGNLEIHESIGYADYALKSFFEKARKAEWYENTLFIITADHTQKLESKDFNHELGRYRVPLIFYHPGYSLQDFNSKIMTQHADIMPSVLDFLGVNLKKQLLYGNSVFSDGKRSFFNQIGNRYLYFEPPYLGIMRDDEAEFYLYDDQVITGKKLKDIPRNQQEIMKAYIQYSINGLIKNQMYY